MEMEKNIYIFFSFKYKTPCLNIAYIQIKIYLLSILHISLQIQYNLNLKIREDHDHYCHISSGHKSYLHICYSNIQPIQLLAEKNCGRSQVCRLFTDIFLQTKRFVRRNS